MIRTWLDALARTGAVLAAVSVGITAIGYVAEVVARYGFDAPLNWASDIGSYMLCAAVFLALPQISRTRGHVSISILVDILPPRVRRVWTRLLSLVTAVTLLAVTWFMVDIGLAQFAQGTLTPMANQIPRWWLTGVMAAGLLVSAVFFVLPPEPCEPSVPAEV